MIYVLSIGTNQPPREERLRDAIAWLTTIADFCFFSTPYATAPIGRDEGNERKHYLNAVAVIELSNVPAEDNAGSLEALLKAYEAGAGRTEDARREGRVPIDMDIVIIDGRIIREKDFGRYYFRQGYEELISLGII